MYGVQVMFVLRQVWGILSMDDYSLYTWLVLLKEHWII